MLMPHCCCCCCHQATHWAIDELKATVPIWKKEFFQDGSMWKENEESRRLLQQQQEDQQQQQHGQSR
jgi:molybdopterin synthase catalytic subunit